MDSHYRANIQKKKKKRKQNLQLESKCWAFNETHGRMQAVGWVWVEILPFKMSHSIKFTH